MKVVVEENGLRLTIEELAPAEGDRMIGSMPDLDGLLEVVARAIHGLGFNPKGNLEFVEFEE